MNKEKANNIIDKVQGLALFAAIIGCLFAEAPMGFIATYIISVGAIAGISGIIRGAINGR